MRVGADGITIALTINHDGIDDIDHDGEGVDWDRSCWCKLDHKGANWNRSLDTD